MIPSRIGGVLLSFALLLASACPTEAPSPQASAPAPAVASPAPASAATPGPNAAPAESDADRGMPLGRILPDAPLPLAAMLGAEPQVVESNLGEPLTKGGTKKTCVRFVPDRVFFECAAAWQRYADRSGTFGAIGVRYEDGRAASIAFEELPGEGPFDPRVALREVGLELPGEPNQSEPAPGVTLWSWFNSAARLLVHDRQYRVEVSSVGGEWAKAKVEVILNHPLTEAQKAKVVDASPQVPQDDGSPR